MCINVQGNRCPASPGRSAPRACIRRMRSWCKRVWTVQRHVLILYTLIHNRHFRLFSCRCVLCNLPLARSVCGGSGDLFPFGIIADTDPDQVVAAAFFDMCHDLPPFSWNCRIFNWYISVNWYNRLNRTAGRWVAVTRPGGSSYSVIRIAVPKLWREQDGYFLFFRFRIATTSDAKVSRIMNSSYVLIIITTFRRISERVRARPPAIRVNVLYCQCAILGWFYWLSWL